MTTQPTHVVEIPHLPRGAALYGPPDYLDDPEGLERWREAAKEGRGHDMAPININSLRRLLDTIERLRAALASTAGDTLKAENERLLKRIQELEARDV